MPCSSTTVHRTKKLPDLWNSLALGLQRGGNSISLQCIPWPLSEVPVWPNFDVRFWGQMTPKVKIFENVFTDYILRITPKYVSWPNLVKIGRCEVPERSRGLPNKKAPQDSSQLPFWPKWADGAQNSPNVVTPWPVHVYRIWSRSAAFCRTYSGKINFSAQKVNTI